MNFEKMNIKWDTRKKILLSNLNILRKKEIYTDLCLLCDGERYSAHRLILSMSSGYFAKALEKTEGFSSSSLLIIICGIKANILQLILNYIYEGMVQITNEDLSDFLKAGMMLKIPGLMELASHYDSLKESTVESVNTESGMKGSQMSQSMANKKNDCSRDSTNISSSEMKRKEKPHDKRAPKEGNEICSNIDSKESYRVDKENVFPDLEPLFDDSFLSDDIEMFEGWDNTEDKIHLKKGTSEECQASREMTPKMAKRKKKGVLAATPVSKRGKKPSTNGGFDTIDDALESVSRSFLENGPQEIVSAIDDSIYEFSASPDSGGIERTATPKSHSTSMRPSEAGPSEPKVCVFCNNEFLTYDSYREHRTSSCEVLECPYCLVSFPRDSRAGYEEHVASHKGEENPFRCPKCLYRTAERSRFEYHIASHTGVPRYSCPLCDFKASLLARVHDHISSAHPAS